MKKYITLLILLLIVGLSSFSVNAATVQLKGITLNKTSITLNKGNSYQLSVKANPTNAAISSVKYSSTNSSIASVSVTGKITAKAPGTATFKATVDKYTASCKVVVKSPITKVSVTGATNTIEVGKSIGLTVTYAPANTTDSKTVIWTSSNTKVATVKNGVVKGIGAGTATITAKMGSKSATYKIVVKAVAPKYINTSSCYTILAKYRSNAKVSALKRDTNLENLAKTRAKELVTLFSHKRPNGTSGLTIIKGNLYKGENIGKGQATCNAIMTGWFNSESHRLNMLSKNYTKVGIAGYQYNGVIYWVMLLSS